MNIIMEDKERKRQIEGEIKHNNSQIALAIISAILTTLASIITTIPLSKLYYYIPSGYESLLISGIGIIAGATIGIGITYKMFKQKSEQERINILALHEKESDLFRSIESYTDELLAGNSKGNSNIRQQ